MAIQVITDAFPDSSLSVETAYSLGIDGVGPPVAISSPAANGGQQASLIAASNTFGPFTYNGDLYALLSTQHNTLSTGVYKSTDAGLSWTQLDAGSAPAFEQATGYYDGVQTVITAYRTSNVGDGAINLQNFDLATGTWGPVYADAAPPNTRGVRTLWKRPDGTLLILYQSRSAFPGSGTSGLGGAVFDPALDAWTTTFDAGAALIALPGWDASQTLVNTANISSCMDDDGNVTVFFNTNSVQTVPVIWGNRCFSQQIAAADDTLGPFTDFPGQAALTDGKQDLTAYSGSPMGRPIVLTDQDTIVLPVLMTNRNGDPFPRQIACLYVGTPISNPVWTVDNTKSIDPGAFIDDTIYPQEWGSTAFDGTTLYVVFSAQAGDPDFQNFSRIRLCQTTNLLSPADGWSAVTAFDLLTDAPPGFDFAGQSLLAPSVSIPGGGAVPIVSCGNPPQGRTGVFYSHAFPATGGTPPYTFSIVAGALLAGLTLDPDTGIVSGTPTRSGFTTFSLQVTDAGGAVSDPMSCSITIVPAALRITFRGIRRMQKADCAAEPERLTPAPTRPKIDEVW